MQVARLEDIPDQGARVIVVDNREIALFRQGEDVFALDNTCPHRGGPIGEGRITGGRVTCPWHEWTFEIATGLCTLNPAARLRQYPVRVEDGQVELSVYP